MFAFVRWWLIVMLIVAGAIVAQISGVYEMIYQADYTMLSFVIIGLAALMSARCGHLTFLVSRTTDQEALRSLDISKEVGWMSATWCARLGLVGTVIGFIVMLGGLHGVDFTDVATTQQVIASMSVGISIALWTTLVGQICNIILTVQYFNLSQCIERLLVDEIEEIPIGVPPPMTASIQPFATPKPLLNEDGSCIIIGGCEESLGK